MKATVRTLKNQTTTWLWFGSVLLAAVAMLAIQTAQADIYIWEDSEGVIHFSNRIAPSGAELYMVEKESSPSDRHAEKIASEQYNEEIERQRTLAESKVIGKLEETEQQLASALERISGLTDQVADTQAQVQAVEEEARQAKSQVVEQQISDRRFGDNRTIIYTNKPYGHHKGYGKHHRHYKKRHHKKKGTYYHYNYGRHKKDAVQSRHRQSSIYKNFYRRPVVPQRIIPAPSKSYPYRVR